MSLLRSCKFVQIGILTLRIGTHIRRLNWRTWSCSRAYLFASLWRKFGGANLLDYARLAHWSRREHVGIHSTGSSHINERHCKKVERISNKARRLWILSNNFEDAKQEYLIYCALNLVESSDSCYTLWRLPIGSEIQLVSQRSKLRHRDANWPLPITDSVSLVNAITLTLRT